MVAAVHHAIDDAAHIEKRHLLKGVCSPLQHLDAVALAKGHNNIGMLAWKANIVSIKVVLLLNQVLRVINIGHPVNY